MGGVVGWRRGDRGSSTHGLTGACDPVQHRGVARVWPFAGRTWARAAMNSRLYMSSGASYSSTGGARGSAAVGCCCARGTSSSFSCRPADEHCTGVLSETERVAYCLLKTEKDEIICLGNTLEARSKAQIFSRSRSLYCGPPCAGCCPPFLTNAIIRPELN